jgi:hypothetical protein
MNDLATRINKFLNALAPHVAQRRQADFLREAVVEIELLQKDADRLDWLADANNTIGNVQLPTQCVQDNIHSLRAAIDAAMQLKDGE